MAAVCRHLLATGCSTHWCCAINAGPARGAHALLIAIAIPAILTNLYKAKKENENDEDDEKGEGKRWEESEEEKKEGQGRRAGEGRQVGVIHTEGGNILYCTRQS